MTPKIFEFWSGNYPILKDAVTQSHALTHTNSFSAPVIWGYDQLNWNP
jgi:hypothetical protein